MSWIVENTWTCSSCGAANKGRHMKCQSCGSPKEAHERYDDVDPNAAPIVTDPKMLAEARAGEHWECQHCQNQNRNLLRKECERCGAPRNDVVRMDDIPPSRGPLPEPRVIRRAVRSMVGKDDRAWVQPAAWTAVGLLMFGFIVWLFVPHEVHATVKSISWRCETELQQRETRHGDGWRSSMPFGAFNTSCHTESPKPRRVQAFQPARAMADRDDARRNGAPTERGTIEMRDQAKKPSDTSKTFEREREASRTLGKAEGQQELIASESLPTEVSPKERALMERWGFVFGEPYPDDALFTPVRLPPGWTKAGTDHSMWSEVHDAKGRNRVDVFYKAAFYDRRARMTLASRYGAEPSENGQAVTPIDRQTGERFPPYEGRDAWDGAEAFLVERFGKDYRNPSHWTE